MPTPIVSVPPLPTTTPPISPWAAVAYPIGPTDVLETACSFWYFYSKNAPLPPPYFAGQFLTDLANHITAAVQPWLTNPICMWDPSAWIWDGTVLHSYTLDLTISDTRGNTPTSLPGQMLVQKWTDVPRTAWGDKLRTGRWWMWPPIAGWVNPNGTINGAGVASMQGVMQQLFLTPFLSQGVIWYPCCWTTKPRDHFFDWVRCRVYPRLVVRHKGPDSIRRRSFGYRTRQNAPAYPTAFG